MATRPQSGGCFEEAAATGSTDAAEPRSSVVNERGRNPLIAFFIPDLTVGGAEQVTVNIANGLARRGYNVDLLLSRFEGELRSQLVSGVTVRTLPPARTPVIGVLAHAPAIVRYVRRHSPDALIPHLEHPSVVCLATDRAAGLDTAVIPTHHSAFGASADETTKDMVVRRLVPSLYPRSDRIIAVSEGVAASIVEQTAVSRDDVSVLHNPVELETVRSMAGEPVQHEWIEDEETPVILFVGRHAEQKGLKTWLQAFEKVADRHPSVRAVLAGTGPQRAEIQEFSNTLGIADRVSMPGYVDNPYRYMKKASTFLLTSEYEGLPTVLIEALACGCQVVATDCVSGPREILSDGEHGRLAPVGDSDAIARAVDKSLSDPVPPETLRARANDFSPDAVMDEYERFIGTHIRSH